MFSLRNWGKLRGEVLTTEQVYIHGKVCYGRLATETILTSLTRSVLLMTVLLLSAVQISTNAPNEAIVILRLLQSSATPTWSTGEWTNSSVNRRLCLIHFDLVRWPEGHSKSGDLRTRCVFDSCANTSVSMWIVFTKRT